MQTPLIDPLNSSTYIASQRRAARRRVRLWFNLIAFGFLLGLIAGHLLFHR